MKQALTGILLIFTVSVTFSMSLAQRITPTPAPTKTATPTLGNTSTPETTEVVVPTTNAENPLAPDSPIDPFTQADFSVLVGNVQRPNGAVWFDDKLYTVCNGDWTLYELDIIQRTTVTYIFGVRNAHTLYAETSPSDQRVRLWTPDFEQNTFGVVDVNGIVTIATDLNGPWGVTPINESFLVTSLLGNTILEISREGEIREIVEGMRSPTGIAADANNIVYVANNGSARRAVEWFEFSSVVGTIEPQPLVSGIQSVTNIVLANDGYLYFAYALGTRGVIGRIDPIFCRESGGCTNDQVEIVVYTELDAPLAGLTISPNLELFVHTIYRPEIYSIDLRSTRRE